MKNYLFFTLFLLVLNPFPAFSSEITIQKGDTLTKIANENNTTIREIMDANNIFDANSLKEGQTIKLPFNSNQYKIHTVKEGESLNQISKTYQVDKNKLIELNKIDNPNNIYVGQKLKINVISSNNLNKGNEKGEDNQYIDKLQEKDQNILKNNEPLIGDVQAEQWKDYGPLKVNVSSWKFKGDDFIANSIHSNGKPLFIAVNCSKRIINRTGSDGIWRDWIAPKEDFEFSLINDICKSEEN